MSTQPAFTWTTAGATDCGPVRPHNEDALFRNETIGLFIVADGMGGHAAGEVASTLAVEAVSGFVERSHDSDEYSWPYGIDPKLSLNANRLRTAVHLANRRVFRAAEGSDNYTGMGSTVVAALVWIDHLAVAHVGDSRLYLYREGELTQLTRDDSWAALMLGRADEPEAPSRHPMRSVLTKVLGARQETDVHILEQRIRAGDLLILCSDGLHNAVDMGGITALLSAGCDLEQTAASLVQCAIECGSRDNVTALLARCVAS